MSGSSNRYPLEAKGIGFIQHRRLKMYMLLVQWSDQNNILIYRTYNEFKSFHKNLKRKFPIEAGHMNKAERCIPKFKDAPVFSRTRRDSGMFLLRLKLLENYTQELFRTNGKISQDEDVTAFFSPNHQDLEPSFPQNSIVIMPSEGGDRRTDKPTQQPRASVIQPISLEQYCCVEAYETKDTKNKPFKVRQGENLDVLLKDTTGWWLVENEEKHLAWFPAPYLTPLQASKDVFQSKESLSNGSFYFAKKCHQAKDSDELSLSAGVVVEVLEKSENGWWLVWYNGKAGYVPSMFLQPYSNPHHRFQAIANNGLCASTPNLLEPESTNVRRWSMFEENLPKRKTVDNENDRRLSPLQRRRSRSLGSLPTTYSKKARPPLTLEVGVLPEISESLSSHSLDLERCPPSLPRNRPEALENIQFPTETIHVLDNERQKVHKGTLKSHLSKDDGLGDSFSTSGSDLSLDSRSEAPKVPQKPRVSEIMQRCTTVTKKALRRDTPTET